jgi:hypothetical protein
MDLVQSMGKNAPNRKKTQHLVLTIKFENGFPTESTIREMLRARKIDDELVSFSDEFTSKSSPKMYWKSNEIDHSIQSFIKFMEFNGIKINGMKTTGEIHSIVFQQK